MGTPEPRPVRIGNAERERAVMVLGDHFAQGRLEPHEYEERMTAAFAARTAAELDLLFDDLPRLEEHRPEEHRPEHRPTALHPTPYPTHAVAPPPPRAVVLAPGRDPQAPYGREPRTGQPYSDKSKVVAGLLQLFLPFGIGRLYSGHVGIGVAQLVLAVVFGIGVVWAFVDGIVILVGRPTDPHGRPLRP